jgi:hypothetical protein
MDLINPEGPPSVTTKTPKISLFGNQIDPKGKGKFSEVSSSHKLYYEDTETLSTTLMLAEKNSKNMNDHEVTSLNASKNNDLSRMQSEPDNQAPNLHFQLGETKSSNPKPQHKRIKELAGTPERKNVSPHIDKAVFINKGFNHLFHEKNRSQRTSNDECQIGTKACANNESFSNHSVQESKSLTNSQYSESIETLRNITYYDKSIVKNGKKDTHQNQSPAGGALKPLQKSDKQINVNKPMPPTGRKVPTQPISYENSPSVQSKNKFTTLP